MNMAKKEPSLLILGDDTPRRSPGRRRFYDEPISVRFEIVTTPTQAEQLKAMAAAEKRPLRAIMRDAVNEYVSDYSERAAIFAKKTSYQPE